MCHSVILKNIVSMIKCKLLSMKSKPYNLEGHNEFIVVPIPESSTFTISDSFMIISILSNNRVSEKQI